ncbi:MAG: hypothetical protein ACPG6V_08260 [Flavobacteriales bacterium]
MEELTFAVIVLQKGRRYYGYIFHKDFEVSNEKQFYRFVEHQHIHDFLKYPETDKIMKLCKSEIKHIDFNLRF